MASASPRCGLLEAVVAIPLLIWPVRATIFVPPSSLDYQPISSIRMTKMHPLHLLGRRSSNEDRRALCCGVKCADEDL